MFTQAKSLQLQRLQQADSAADQMLQDGEIDMDGYRQYKGMVAERMQPLLQEQEQHRQEQVKRQEQEEMRQHAHMQALENQAAQARAKALESRIVRVQDPVTGKAAYLYEASPNKWEEVEFKAAKEPQAPKPSGGGDGGI